MAEAAVARANAARAGGGRRTHAPVYGEDIYARRALQDTNPYFRVMRDLGPAVWLSRHKMWAVTRFEEVRAALRARDVLINGAGVSANRVANGLNAPITIAADGEVHQRRRTHLAAPMQPQALAPLRATIEAEAERAVAEARAAGWLDAMPTLAAHLPLTVVADLVGLDPGGRARMLRWAAQTFDVMGVLNLRGLKAIPGLFDLKGYTDKLTPGQVAPGRWAAALFQAAERGELSGAEANAMIIDYVAPSLDTTILASGHMLWRLTEAAGVLAELKADPALISGVVNEVVRLSSPIRHFTRLAADDYAVGEAVVRKGERLLVVYASANRDERRYADPDAFDVRRNPRDHVGWGHGVHSCAGMHLARMELEALLKALVAQVERVECGTPTPLLNNILQGFKTLPVRLH